MIGLDSLDFEKIVGKCITHLALKEASFIRNNQELVISQKPIEERVNFGMPILIQDEAESTFNNIKPATIGDKSNSSSLSNYWNLLGLLPLPAATL